MSISSRLMALTIVMWLLGVGVAVGALACTGTYLAGGLLLSDHERVFQGGTPGRPLPPPPAYPDILSTVSIALRDDGAVDAEIITAVRTDHATADNLAAIDWSVLPVSHERTPYRDNGYVGVRILFTAPDLDAWEVLAPHLALSPDPDRKTARTIGRANDRWAFRAVATGPPPIVRLLASQLVENGHAQVRHEIRLTMPGTAPKHNAQRVEQQVFLWNVDTENDATLVARDRRGFSGSAKNIALPGAVGAIACLFALAGMSLIKNRLAARATE